MMLGGQSLWTDEITTIQIYLAHYPGDSIKVEVFQADDLVSAEAIALWCRQIASGSSRVWLSLCREWHLDPRGDIHGWFEENMALVEAFRFPGVRLYLYRELPEEKGMPEAHEPPSGNVFIPGGGPVESRERSRVSEPLIG